MKKIVLLLLVFLLLGSVYASDFSTVTVEGVDFEIPSQYSGGNAKDNKYVFKDLRTFAIMCVDDYIVSNYGGYADICDNKQQLSIDGRPCMLLSMYNKYIKTDVSYLYFPVNQSVYCICFQANNVTSDISHIVESAPGSDLSADEFYLLLDESVKEHEEREYLDTVNDNDVIVVNNQDQDDEFIKWFLLTQLNR